MADKHNKRWHLSTPAIAGLVALVSGLVTLAFTLSPSLKPDPGNAISATLRVVKIEPDASYAAYAKRLGDDAPDASTELRKSTHGYIVYLQLDVNGRKRRKLELRESTYLAKTKKRYLNLGPAIGFKSETPSDRWIAPLYAQSPGLHQQFFKRYELYDRGVMLAVADTRALPGGLSLSSP